MNIPPPTHTEGGNNIPRHVWACHGALWCLASWVCCWILFRRASSVYYKGHATDPYNQRGSRLGSLYYSGSDVCPQYEKIGFVLGFHPCFILVRASFGRGWPDRNSQEPYPRSLALPRKCDITRNPEVCSFLQKTHRR
jgi:hypothetical protein